MRSIALTLSLLAAVGSARAAPLDWLTVAARHLRAAGQPPERPRWEIVETATQTERGQRWRRVTLAAVDPLAPAGPPLATGVVWLYVPPGATTFALGLPGWRLPAIDHARRGDLGARADALGVALVLAEMQTTVYEAALYPERRRDRVWCGADCRLGGLGWVRDVVLPFAEAQIGEAAGVFGLSTGGQGALAVAAFARPALPVCAASGTYDLEALSPGSGEYRIHAYALGERREHPARWRAHDLVAHAARVEGPVLLLHGGADESVPAAQSEAMARALTAAGRAVTLRITPGAGHDWAFWRPAMAACLDFIAAGR